MGPWGRCFLGMSLRFFLWDLVKSFLGEVVGKDLL